MDYESLRDNTALPLIKKNGREITLTRPGSSSGWAKKFNPVTGTYYWEDADGNSTDTDPATDVHITGYAIGTKLDYKLLAESLIQSTDSAMIVAGLPALAPGDRIVDGGLEYRVVFNQPVKPAEIVLVQKVVMR